MRETNIHRSLCTVLFLLGTLTLQSTAFANPAQVGIGACGYSSSPCSSVGEPRLFTPGYKQATGTEFQTKVAHATGSEIDPEAEQVDTQPEAKRTVTPEMLVKLEKSKIMNEFIMDGGISVFLGRYGEFITLSRTEQVLQAHLAIVPEHEGAQIITLRAIPQLNLESLEVFGSIDADGSISLLTEIEEMAKQIFPCLPNHWPYIETSDIRKMPKTRIIAQGCYSSANHDVAEIEAHGKIVGRIVSCHDGLLLSLVEDATVNTHVIYAVQDGDELLFFEDQSKDHELLVRISTDRKVAFFNQEFFPHDNTITCYWAFALDDKLMPPPPGEVVGFTPNVNLRARYRDGKFYDIFDYSPF
jgi:hypothetical protein